MNKINGYFLYDGKHTTQQVPNIKMFFEPLLIDENFELIIEIGTSYAGLTYILDDIINKNNLNHNIHTFDLIHRDYVESELIKRNCKYNILDEYQPKFKTTIIDLISQNGKTLILCDGGNKISEFNTYSEYLKKGDFIMAHDYSFDLETFNTTIKDKYWNWFEISHNDISDSIHKNNLVEYTKINFNYAAWACFKKI
jgi:hypothetical protein